MATKKRSRTWTRYSRAEQDEILAQLSESGLGVAEFAATIGLEKSRLYRWRQRARTEEVELASVPTEFVPVRVIGDSNQPVKEPRSFLVTHGSGWTVSVPPGFDAADLKRLLGAVDQAC